MSEQYERKSNQTCVYGSLTVESMGPQNDLHEYDSLTINKAHDYALVDALASRGYDVRVKEVSKAAVERRKRSREKREAEASEG